MVSGGILGSVTGWYSQSTTELLASIIDFKKKTHLLAVLCLGHKPLWVDVNYSLTELASPKRFGIAYAYHQIAPLLFSTFILTESTLADTQAVLTGCTAADRGHFVKPGH